MATHRVLIIDDAPLIHALVRARLSGQALDLFTAGDGASGIEVARQSSPDLILLDIDMPGIDGLEVCRRLKSDALTADIPVIFLTGEGATEQKIRGLELGAVDYVTKPFDPAELAARVRSALRTSDLLQLVARKALIDGLTGLWNRTYLEKRLAAELSSSLRHARPLSVIMLDVDRFKLVNDRHGHGTGDEVLREVARAFLQSTRTEDVACRYGGEEFLLLLPDTLAINAAVLAERIRQSVEQLEIRHRTGPLKVTASVGIADTIQSNNDSPVDLADAAMYAAKQAGRNRVQIASITPVPA